MSPSLKAACSDPAHAKLVQAIAADLKEVLAPGEPALVHQFQQDLAAACSPPVQAKPAEPPKPAPSPPKPAEAAKPIPPPAAKPAAPK